MSEKKSELTRAHVLQQKLGFNEKDYEFDHGFKAADLGNPLDIHTTAELVAFLERNKDKKIELDAKVLCFEKGNPRKKILSSITREAFTESFKNGYRRNFREGMDAFSTDSEIANSGKVGQDNIPLLGGPFYKQLYYYQDYIRMHGQSFYAYHHDPVAKATTDIITNFVMGKGFRIDSDFKPALAVWRAFEKVNDVQEMMCQFCQEESTYGEDMIWKLPGNQTKMTYRLGPNDTVPIGFIPRVRLVDPSNIVEIVTYPEDITRQLYYVWLTPTQYQQYTGAGQTANVQPTLKFIYRQIPAEQMLHYKLNCMSNEKRGRSDYYPILGYMKRLRDAVNYSMIGQLKQAAWSIDTQVEGSQKDIDAYAQSIKAMGQYAPGGSEFIHSSKVTRTFLNNQAGRTGQHEIFEWCWSMIASGTGIPVSYYGTHLSGGQTRASALVATEPVAKKMERRQEHLKRPLKAMWDYCMQWASQAYGDKRFLESDCEITFPEIITQDRSAKLKDLALGEVQGWFSKERVSETAAKEMGFNDYEYQEEMQKEVDDPAPPPPAPLTTPGSLPLPGAPPKPSAVTKDEKKKIGDSNGF